MESIPENVVMHEVSSSNIKAIGHDGVFTMYVRFINGTEYAYMNVGKDIFEAFKTAPSVGRYFNASVKEKYPFEKIEKIMPKPARTVRPVGWIETENTYTAVVHRVGGKLERGSEHSAAFDLRIAGALQLPPGQRATVGTGIKLAMPEQLCAFILPRSGNASKKGITVLNSPGLIDPDYSGELGVILYNSSDETFIAQEGDRIAQIMFVPFVIPIFEDVEALQETERGDGGFGSTGIK